MSKMELLAPAGNFDCLIAAVQSGADAVYLSGKAFGARSFADNFDKAELERAAQYCHLRGVKVYVTVNTLALDKELDELCEYLIFLNNIGVDAIIVQDMGVLALARELVPDLPLHASTQMTIHNSEGVRLLESLGIKRVVLSREVSIENMRKISQKTGAELEVFAHGALCMSYSGQCLMSSIIGARSGNRGKCAQPCRLPYTINGGKQKKFFLSLKDLSSLNHLKELSDIGVASLKIEGRMKGAAYVAAVVGIYRKYIDNPQRVSAEDIEILDRIFNRGGLTDGYLTENTGREMFAFDKPDNPYRKGSDTLEQELLNGIRGENRKTMLQCQAELKLGERPGISVTDGRITVEYICDFVADKAQKTALTIEMVETQLTKTGGTPFEISKLDITLDDGVFVSAGALNSMRRTVLEMYAERLIKSFRRETARTELHKIACDRILGGGFVCEVTEYEQFGAVKDMEFSEIYVPLHIIEQNLDKIMPYKEKTAVVLPAIVDEQESEGVFCRTQKLLETGFCGVVAMNLSQIYRFSGYRIFGGFRLNVFNSRSLDFFKNSGIERVELSPELNLRQLGEIKKTASVQTMVYGRLPLMVTENCIIRNDNNCPCTGKNTITDRMGMVFPVINDGNSCRSVVLNCKKTFMAFDMDKIKRAGIDFYRLYFTDETSEECIRICDTFLKNTGYRPEDFTGGHYQKGVK